MAEQICRCKQKAEARKNARPIVTYYDLLFNAIVEAKVNAGGWGYKRAAKFAEKRLQELNVAAR
jgi:hypothetical protein